ncbi:MAG TPA: RDD family protein [Longimicrobium sp.]|nr:RDD family protein [Longimicrobium sp.]
MSSVSDTRHIIRPEHFALAPHLLGRELARPSRRLAAILVDFAIVGVLVQSGGGFLLSLAAAYAFFRFAARQVPNRRGRKRRLAFQLAGSVLLFAVVSSGWSRATRIAGRWAGNKVEAEVAGLGGSGGEGMRAMSSAIKAGVGMKALQGADSREKALEAAPGVVAGLRASGASDSDIREAFAEVVGEHEDRPWLRGTLDEVLADSLRGKVAAAQPLPADSLAVRYAAAVAAHDSAAVDSLRPAVGSALARDSLDELRGKVTELRAESTELAAKLEVAENTGLLQRLRHLLDDLGIGFGWTGLYFTAFTALWRGQTPGKRLFGVRVVRLDGEPLTMWGSFERFGGYAAGLVTGLLGFAQVLWDRNRQAIHDKISETVVVRERGDSPEPAPGPAPRPERRGA